MNGFPVEEKGWYVPVSADEGLGTHTIHVTESGADSDSPHYKK